MSIWAVILYGLEVCTLIGTAKHLRRAREKSAERFSHVAGISGLVLTAVGFFAIYKLTQQSSVDYAVVLGIIYAALTMLHLPGFFAVWARGFTVTSRRRGILTALNSIAGLILISILAFAG